MSQPTVVRQPSPSARRATSPSGMLKSNITVLNLGPPPSPSGGPSSGLRPSQNGNAFQPFAAPSTTQHPSPSTLQLAPHPNTYHRAVGFNNAQGQPLAKPLPQQMQPPPPPPQAQHQQQPPPQTRHGVVRAPSPHSQGPPAIGNRVGPSSLSPPGNFAPGPPTPITHLPPATHPPPPPPLALLRVQHQLKTANDQQRANLAQLRSRYDQLLQHNENLGEEFLRLRMVLDELREGVRGCVRHHVFSLRNSFSELKEFVSVQCSGMAEDFDTVKRVVSKLGRHAVAAAHREDFVGSSPPRTSRDGRLGNTVSPQKSTKNTVITNLYDKTPTRSTPGRRITSPSRRTPGSYHLGGTVGNSQDDDTVVQLLQEVSVQKAVLEERMQRIEEEHARHVRHLKLLHQDRENTLLSQLNMLSSVADRRDRETAAAIELSAYRATAGPRDLDPAGTEEDVPSERDFIPGVDAERRGTFVDSGLRFAKGDLIDVASPAPNGKTGHLRDDPYFQKESRQAVRANYSSSLDRGATVGNTVGAAYSEQYLQKRNAGAIDIGVGSRTRSRPRGIGKRDTSGVPRVATLRASSASRRRSPEVKRMSIIR